MTISAPLNGSAGMTTSFGSIPHAVARAAEDGSQGGAAR
jgi:hypothetical protein